VSETRSIDPNDHDRFILRQRFRLMTNEYVFSLPGADGESPGQDLCFVRQRTFKLKEDIGFYTDESRSAELMRIRARQRFDPRARYDVTAGDGTKIGEIQKVFGASLLRSTYRLYGATGTEVAAATERNAVVAIFRRLTGFLGFIPIAGLLVDFLPIPYHFVFLRDGVELGSHRRHLWKIRDTYTIDMSGDPDRTVDRRLILAIAVGMDALQAR
jgi:uncharacterized protein YxjI